VARPTPKEFDCHHVGSPRRVDEQHWGKEVEPPHKERREEREKGGEEFFWVEA